MALEIFMEQSRTILKLLKNRRLFDTQELKYYHNLDGMLTPLEVSAIRKKGYIIKDGQRVYGELLTGLISGLDKLLKRNKMSPKALKTYKIQGNLGKDSTSHKIASAFVAALKLRVDN